MTAKLLSEKAIAVINEYRNFNTGFAVCNIPYYNNRHTRLRGALKAHVGKGSPQDIREELKNVAALQKINLKAIDSITLKKLLVDNNVGIDCSGLAYYILDAESRSKGKGSLSKHISFTNGFNFLRKIKNKLHPEKNTGVVTFASDKNSRPIELRYIQPGDMITMLGGPDNSDRDHVLIVHEVDYKDDVVVAVSYVHAVAWPTDGEYGHGVRQGQIRVTNVEKLMTEQDWIEADMTGEHNYTFTRAQKSKTELRRLNWL